MEANYRVFYHPYSDPEKCESVVSYANSPCDAKWFALTFGIPFRVEALNTDSAPLAYKIWADVKGE